MQALKPLRVISASRRIDLLACFPEKFIDILKEKCPPEKVHTLVIWTKNCNNLTDSGYLSDWLRNYRQIYIHYTISGMGGTILEPNIPREDILLGKIGTVIEFIKSPERIIVRFDPVVHLRFPDGYVFSNINKFEKIAKKAAEAGIKTIKFSWMQEYKKVLSRLAAHKIYPVLFPKEEKVKELSRLKDIARFYRVKLEGCCMEETSVSSCINGFLFNELHPNGEVCSTKKAKGQRSLCGCTESWDIGWYYPCPNGCLYCYANPKVINRNEIRI